MCKKSFPGDVARVPKTPICAAEGPAGTLTLATAEAHLLKAVSKEDQ
jgi:hypothetical protein